MGRPEGRWGPFYVFVQDLMTSPWCTCTTMNAIVAPLTPAMTRQEWIQPGIAKSTSSKIVNPKFDCAFGL
jgi:hypothetical protein